MDTNFSNFQMIDNIDDLNKIDDNQYIKYKDLMGHKIDQIKTANPKLAQAMVNFMNAHDELRRLLGKRTGSSFTDFNSGVLNIFKTAGTKASEINEATRKSSDALSSLNEAVKFQRALEALEEGESPTNANVGNIDLTPEEVFEMQIKAKLEKIKDSLNRYNELERQFLNANEQLKKGYALGIAICIQSIVLCFKQMNEKLEKSPLKDGDTHNIVKKCWKFYDLVEKLADKSHTEHNAAELSRFINNHGKLINIAPYLFDNMGKVKEVTDVAENTLKNLEFWSEQNSPKYTTLSQNLENLKKSFNRFTSSKKQYSFLYNNDDEYIDIAKCNVLDNNTLTKIEGMIKAYDDALNVLELNIEHLQPDIANGGEDPSMIPGIAEQNELIKTCNTLIAAFEASSAPNQTMIKAAEIAKNAKQQHAKVCQALIDADQAINALPKFSKIRKNLREKTQDPLIENQKQLTKMLKDALQNQQISNVALNTVYSGLDTNLKTSGDILKSHNVVCNFLEQSTGQSLDELFDLPPQLQSFDFHKALDDFENFYALNLSDLGKILNVSEERKPEILHNIVEKFKRLGEEVDKARPKEEALRDLALDTLESNNSSLGPKSNPFLRESLAKLRNVHNLANQEQNRPNIHSLALADEAAIDLIAHANDMEVVEEIRSNVPTSFLLHQYSEIAAQNFIASQNKLIFLIKGMSDFYPNLGQYALQNIRSALLAYKSAKAQLSNIVKSYKLLTENENYLQDLKQIDNYLQNAQRPYTGSTQRIAKARDNFLQAHNALTQRFISTGSSAYNQQTRTLLENFYKAAKQMSDLFSDNDVGPLLLLSQFD